MIETRVTDVPAAEGARAARITAHLSGEGPLAVLLHGFPLDHRMWLDVLQGPLRRMRTLCAIDLRGHGHSPWSGDAAHTMERMADDVAHVIGALGHEQADVCGLSMGGYVAMALHARHLGCVRSLVLTNTRAAADTPAQAAARDDAIRSVATQGRGAIVEAMLPKLLPEGADLQHMDRIRTMIEATPAETVIADLRGLQQRPDRRPELSGIHAPTLVVAGDRDVLTPLAETREWSAQIPGADLAVIEGTGHMSPLEDQPAWSRAVSGFWR